MAQVSHVIGDPKRRPDFARYRKVQIFEAVKRRTHQALRSYQTLSEKAWMAGVNAIVLRASGNHRFRALLDRLEDKYSPYIFHVSPVTLSKGQFVKGSEMFDAAEDGLIRGVGARQMRLSSRNAQHGSGLLTTPRDNAAQRFT
ncbi:hypothetical protein [Bradyrhizobium genosp. P]|uniref:hypothetical protein n=1 Tax=Bradyrhizobium genosp. P TaxID=83641 RepID=UPI003CFB2820